MVKITAEVTVELIAKEKKILETILQNFVKATKENMKEINVIKEEFGKPEKISLKEGGIDMYSGFIILTVETENLKSLFNLYLAYMGPIRIEIIEPTSFKVEVEEMQEILNNITLLLQHIQVSQLESKKKLLGIE